MCTAEEALEEIERVQTEQFPDLPLFEIVRLFFQHPRELCVTSITDPWTNWLIGTEAACKRYGCLPFAGGWLDQPLWVIDVFDEIASTHVLFEKKRMAELNKKRE